MLDIYKYNKYHANMYDKYGESLTVGDYVRTYQKQEINGVGRTDTAIIHSIDSSSALILFSDGAMPVTLCSRNTSLIKINEDDLDDGDRNELLAAKIIADEIVSAIRSI